MNDKVNALIDIISVLTVLFVFITNRHHQNRDEESGNETEKGHRLFDALMICVIIVLFLDIPAWLLDGADFPGARGLCMTLDTGYYLAQIVYCRLWLMYVDGWISGFRPEKSALQLLLSLPMLAEVALIIINIKTGWIFGINTDNVYSRGPFYHLNLFPYYFYILTALLCAVTSVYRNRKNKTQQKDRAVLAFMFLPICGILIETVSYGLSLLWPFTAASLLMVYLTLQEQRLTDRRVAAALEAEKSAILENELADCRMRIMLSQIQPHFVYNCLSVISALCDINPELAAGTTGDFLVYLRGNMESLDSDRMIPFDKELEHTERYLALEKLRFENRLSVSFDIKARDFDIPALTLQPIAENAVRYGITKREDGGRLIISTCENENEYRISIKDNGVGFDSLLVTDNRTHIGIANVKKRLDTMCRGTLSVVSITGVGTEAVITVPKVKDLQENNK